MKQRLSAPASGGRAQKAASDCRSRGAWRVDVLPVSGQVITGVLLMFYYRPHVQYAYQDIQDLRAHVTLGLMARDSSLGGTRHDHHHLAAYDALSL